jgi:hypothetical protein
VISQLGGIADESFAKGGRVIMRNAVELSMIVRSVDFNAVAYWPKCVREWDNLSRLKDEEVVSGEQE